MELLYGNDLKIERQFHRLFTTLSKKNYEKRLLTISLLRSGPLQVLLSKFNDLINDPRFRKWYEFTLYCSYMEKIKPDHLYTAREYKEQRLIIRNVLRLSYSNLYVTRLCDYIVLIYKL